MPRRAVNLALLVLVPLLAGTGLLAWIAPEPATIPLLVAHRIAGVGLLLGFSWKYGIARRSLRRRTVVKRDASLIVGAIASLALLLVLGLGLAWTIGAISFDRPLEYSLLNVHVLVGVALVPIVVAHAAQRWETRPAVADLFERRVALRALAVGAGAIVATVALDRIGLARRPTGSRHAASFTGNDFPLTIWRVDQVPEIDRASWTLEVAGAVSSPVRLSYDELIALPTTERDALIDCTGGWWSEQQWRGVTLADLLGPRAVDSRAHSIEVTSVTGHAWTFLVSEARDLLLATHVGGEPLAPGHGYPARLVAPEHRGFVWIKWVARVTLT